MRAIAVTERSPLVATIDQVVENVLRLHEMAIGSAEERRFHHDRVKNAHVLVALDTEEALIYASSKFAGYRDNGLHHLPLLGERHGATTNRYISRLLGEPIKPGSPKFERLEKGYRDYCKSFGFEPSQRTASARFWHITGVTTPFPDEVPTGQQFHEGACKSVVVNRYERDPRARRRCIAHYGTNCAVCSFDFEAVYGNLGQDFIHVHHLVPLGTIKRSYQVDPISDLRPVCPNCHAMLHRNGELISIEVLKSIIDGAVG